MDDPFGTPGRVIFVVDVVSLKTKGSARTPLLAAARCLEACYVLHPDLRWGYLFYETGKPLTTIKERVKTICQCSGELQLLMGTTEQLIFRNLRPLFRAMEKYFLFVVRSSFDFRALPNKLSDYSLLACADIVQRGPSGAVPQHFRDAGPVTPESLAEFGRLMARIGSSYHAEVHDNTNPYHEKALLSADHEGRQTLTASLTATFVLLRINLQYGNSTSWREWIVTPHCHNLRTLGMQTTNPKRLSASMTLWTPFAMRVNGSVEVWHRASLSVAARPLALASTCCSDVS